MSHILHGRKGPPDDWDFDLRFKDPNDSNRWAGKAVVQVDRATGAVRREFRTVAEAIQALGMPASTVRTPLPVCPHGVVGRAFSCVDFREK